MKINRIKIQNFRNHATTDITFDKLVCVRGANHSGKSSIQQAIEFALTGRSDATTAGGAGASALIQQGHDKAIVLLKLQANKEIDFRCSLTEASGRTVTLGDPNDPAWNGASVKAWLDSQKTVLSCLLNSRYFINLAPKEQKAVLASMILPDSYEWPAERREQAAEAGLLLNWDTCSAFDLIEAGYETAFNRRRDVNRELKNLQVPEVIAMPEGSKSSAETQKRLGELRSSIYEAERQRTETLKQRSGVLAKIAGIEQRIESLQAKIRLERETVSHHDRLILGRESLKEHKKVVSGEKRLGELKKEEAHLRELVAGIRSTIALFEGLADKLQCPVCRREVTMEFLAAQLKPHKDALAKALDSQNENLRTMQALGDIEGSKRMLAEHETALAGKKRSESIISENTGLLRTAQEELEELKASVPDEPVEDSDIAQVRKHIERMEADLADVAVAEARAQEIERVTARQAKLQRAATTLESLVKYFGPDGVKAELLAGSIGTFTAAMNAGLAPWGYSCDFQIEPYGFIVVNLTTRARLPLELLSGSERLRFAVAFQVALAQVSGIRMVVVDEADLLDTEGRDVFYPLLLGADLDQAIAIGTSESEEIAEVPGAVFYMMQGGNALQLQPVGA